MRRKKCLCEKMLQKVSTREAWFKQQVQVGVVKKSAGGPGERVRRYWIDTSPLKT